MHYDAIHPLLRSAMGTHEGFRKAGFPASSIFVEAFGSPEVRDDELMIFVTLKSHGKEFRVSIGPWPRGKEDELRDQWLALCAAVNDGSLSQDDMDRIWQESIPFNNAVGFTLAIANKGIPIPGVPADDLDEENATVVVAPCTFCSGTVTLRMAEGSAEHTRPTCKKFRKLDPLEFVQAMNAHVAKKRWGTAN